MSGELKWSLTDSGLAKKKKKEHGVDQNVNYNIKNPEDSLKIIPVRRWTTTM